MPAATIAASTATTVSPAPETSRTLTECAGTEIGLGPLRPAPFCTQHHALLAAGHQHGLALDHAVELGHRGGDIGFGRDGVPAHFRKLMAVRRDQGRSGVAGKVLALRIDDQRLAGLARRVDQGAHDTRRQHALGVVGQHDRRDPRQRRERRRRSPPARPRPKPASPAPSRRAADGSSDAPRRNAPCGWSAATGSTTRWASIEGSADSAVCSVRAASSSPITLTKTQRAPSAATLRATLPAPPTTSSLLFTVSTCTGASGEMRLTSP